MSHSVDVRIPYEYKKLILNIVDYLGDDSPSVKSLQYNFLDSLVSSPDKVSDFLYPYALLDGFYLSRTFVQKQIIARLEFIFSPTSLYDFLCYFPCSNSLRSNLVYSSIYKWRLDYYDRSLSRADSKAQMLIYIENGGLEEIRELFKNWRISEYKEPEVNTAEIVDNLSEEDLNRLLPRW